MLIVTPGIQLPETQANDQTRVATPQIAAASGASHIVVGRAITKAARPSEAFAMAEASFNAGRH
jgi:orotidine-5'-phosphate decarboxylase